MFKYRIPVNLPSAPTPEVIEREFPVSYSYDKLNHDTCYYVAQNRYVGLDNTGHRYGNFIGHALAFDADDYPVKAIGSTAFWHDLPEELKNLETTPDYLAEVSEREVLSGCLTFDEVVKFLREDTSRIRYLRSMTNATFECFRNHKRIVICDAQERIPYWFAGITYAFPLMYAKQMTFNTYVYDLLEEESMLCGVLPEGTVYQPSVINDYGMFYIFDFEHEFFNYENETGMYAGAVEKGYLYDTEELEQLHRFILDMKCDLFNTNVYDVCNAYRVLNGDMREISTTDVEGAFSLVVSCENEFAAEYFHKVLAKLEESDVSFDEYIYLCVKYVNQVVAETADAVLYHELMHGYWKSIMSMSKHASYGATEVIKTLMKKVFQISASLERDLLEAFAGYDISTGAADILQGNDEMHCNVFWARLILQFAERKRLNFEKLADAYDMSALREIYVNLQFAEQPVAWAREIIKGFRSDLGYQFLRSLVTIYQSNLETKLQLEQEILSLLRNDEQLNNHHEFFDSLVLREEYPIKTEVAGMIIRGAMRSVERFNLFCDKAKQDAAYWESEQGTIFEHFCNANNLVRLPIKELYGLTMQVLDDFDCASVKRVVTDAFDDCLQLKDISSFGPEEIPAYLSKLQKQGLSYTNTKVYSVFILQNKLSPETFETEINSGAITGLEWGKFNQSEFDYAVTKVFRMMAPKIISERQHHLIATFFVDEIERFWKVYSKLIVEATECYPSILCTYFMYADDRGAASYPYMVDEVAKQNKRRRELIYKVLEKRATGDLRNAFIRFTTDVEKAREGAKTGVFDKVINLFGRRK